MLKKINRVDKIATHYGFKTTKIPPVHINGIPSFRPEEKITVLKSYLAKKRKEEDSLVSMVYNNRAILRNNRISKKNTPKLNNFSFDIMGVENSIAEAIVIQTAVTALKEEGFNDVSVDINSVGDKESFTLFKEELTNYYKENIDQLHPKCRDFEKTGDILNLLTCNHKECKQLRANAPKSIYFLSEKSQKHLKEVLEHLESTNITYRINNSLISHDDLFSKIIFEIKSNCTDEDEEVLLGKGGRYDDLAERITRKKISSAVGISIEIKKVKTKKVPACCCNKPKFYFIQFGPKAKLRSLSIIELLRQSNLIIQQSLYMDRLTEQIEVAKHSDVPYAIIMGQKEADEDTVIIKDFRKACQETIPTACLLPYLQQLK